MAVTEATANALIRMMLGDLESHTYTVEIPDARGFVDAAAHILYVAEGPTTPGAKEPGGFTRALIHTLFQADKENLGRLARVYPALASNVHMYKNQPGGDESLRRVVLLLGE